MYRVSVEVLHVYLHLCVYVYVYVYVCARPPRHANTCLGFIFLDLSIEVSLGGVDEVLEA